MKNKSKIIIVSDKTAQEIQKLESLSTQKTEKLFSEIYDLIEKIIQE